MKVKIKKLVENAVIPSYQINGDAGMDLTAVSYDRIDSEHVRYNFGIAVEIPEGHVGLIFPRSSCYKQRQIMSNAVGVIDSNYRGGISAVMLGNHFDYMYTEGQRCAQLLILPYPLIEFEQVDELQDSERGSNGYGSSGK